MEDALLPIAQAEADLAKAEGGSPALIFFTVKSEARLPQQLRSVCDLKTVSDSPQVNTDEVSLKLNTWSLTAAVVARAENYNRELCSPFSVGVAGMKWHRMVLRRLTGQKVSVLRSIYE